MTIDSVKLRELAEKATPGPWDYSPWHIEEGPSAVIKKENGGADEWCVANTSSDADAAHIAAANPAAIIAMCDALDAANKRIAELENKIAIDEGVFS